MPEIMEAEIIATEPELAVASKSGAALAIMTEVEALAVVDQPSAEFANGILKRVKSTAKETDENRRSWVDPLNAQVKRINDLFRAPLDILTRAESCIKGKLLAYQTAEEEKRRAEERRLAEIAEKERQRLAKLAEKAEARGDEKRAEAFTARAEEVPVPVAAPPPKVAGLSYREDWRAELVSLAEVVKAAAAGNELALSFLTFDQGGADRKAKALKGAVGVPGVRWVCRKVAVSR
jgi:hypothetical protein